MCGVLPVTKFLDEQKIFQNEKVKNYAVSRGAQGRKIKQCITIHVVAFAMQNFLHQIFSLKNQ